MSIEIDSEDAFRDVLLDTDLLLADFYAGWCEPCKWLDLILDSMENELPKGSRIIKIDVEKQLELASKFEIRSVPVLILFKNGHEVWRINGFLMKEGLLQKLDEFSRGT
jgi:thioredoxin 1